MAGSSPPEPHARPDTYDELRGPDLDPAALEPGAPAAPDGRRAHPAGPQRGAGRRRGRGAGDDSALLAVARQLSGRRQPQVPRLLDPRLRVAAGSARDVRRRPRDREHRRGPGGLPSGNGRLPRLRPRRDPARVRRLRHLHPRVGAARAAGLGRWWSRRAVLPRGRVAVRGLRRRLHPASRVRDHARPEQLDRRPGASTATRCTRPTAP